MASKNSNNNSSNNSSNNSGSRSSSSATATMTSAHDHRTAKIVELVSSSSRSFEEAIENALTDARQSTRGISGAQVEAMSVQCEDGRITAYKVNLKLVFGVERRGGKDE
jgi:flavin-binding protein dodecin